MKRLLVILLGALLLAVTMIVSTLVVLAATEGGTRFLADQAERFLPLELEDVSGALLREIRVGRLRAQAGDRTVEIESLRVAVQLYPLLFENELNVDTLTARSVTVSAGAPDAPSEPSPPLELPFLPVEVDVAAAAVERLDVAGAFPMRIQASAALTRRGLTVRGFRLSSDVVDLDVAAELGSGANPLLRADVAWSLPESAWSGEGHLEGRVNDLQIQHTLRGMVSGEAAGSASLADVTAPAVDLQVDMNDMEFGPVTVAGAAGRLRGTLANLIADVSGRVSVPEVEPFNLSVAAYGPVGGPLTLRDVTADAFGGTQQAQGSVAWNDRVQVHLGGSFSDVDLATLREALNGQVSAQFQFAYEDEHLALGLEALSGTFEGRPVDGRLQIVQSGDGWNVAPLELAVGRNRLNGRASLTGDRIDLNGDVAAPNLAALNLGVAGDVAGHVRVRGVWPDLSGSARLQSTELSGFDVTLTETVIDASMSSGSLHGTVRAGQVNREQLTLDSVALDADGTLSEFRWQLGWASGEGAGRLRRRDDGFEVAVSQARVTAIEQDWTLDRPTRVLLLGDRVELGPACVSGGDAGACVESFVYADGAIDTRGRLDRAPVGLLAPWLPVRLDDAGYLEGGWNLAGTPQALEGELDLAARQLTFLPDAAVRIALQDLEASGEVRDGVLDVRLAARDPQFNVLGNARAQSMTQDGALSGTIQVVASDLAPLKVFDQRLQEVGGRMEGDLLLSGTVGAPRLEGLFRVDGGHLKLNDPDVALDDMNLRLRLDDNGTFDARGSARQGEEEVRVTVSGSGLFRDTLALDATLAGERLQARHPDWEISVSPDLDFTYAQGRGRLRGRLEVPQAEVRLSTLPSSVPSPSEDVVVVGRETGNGGSQGWFRADVDVVLGEDVVLKALGITAELEGTLRARLDAQGRTTLRGTLNVAGGVLSTQGQTLTIESGSVVYNGPVTRPYIDLRAVRVIDDVTPSVKVGLHIRGDADNLTSSVYSEPPMAETRALSFLVLGRDIDEETASADGSQLMAAAINLGLARSKGITSELMRMTGLDELSAAAESGESFAIIAGKRVTDDLYVRYTYNTLSAVGVFLVRYELTDRWQLEAQSGEESAMDLMYRMEK